MCERDDLMESCHNEYRAVRPLKLGEDITSVATDNEVHKLYVKNYFDKHNIQCKVILFNELK